MANYHVAIHDDSRPRMVDLVLRFKVSVLPSTQRQVQDTYSIEAIATSEQIDESTNLGYRLDRYENLDAARMPSIATRATDGSDNLTVDEVEQAWAGLAGANSDIVEFVELPVPTHEARRSHAVHVHGGDPAKTAVVFLGGIHAREWGSPDILINFLQQVITAYSSGNGITQGSYVCTNAEVGSIVNTLDIIVFPLANPDGRNYSMTTDPLWRKNRRHAGAGDPVCLSGGGNGPGVDLNHNYDFLWDFQNKFSPAAGVRTSTDPCDATFNGPRVTSEPETQNVVWLVEGASNLGYFIDIHSFGEDILYSWGDEDDRTTDPSMNFREASFDTKRGVLDSDPGGDPAKYAEYLPVTDLDSRKALGSVMTAAIQVAHGRAYTLKSSANLYPTSGTSPDYAYARKFTDPTTSTVLSYTIEWCPARSEVAASFHPDYVDMVRIIEEITAALLAFCIAVAKQFVSAPQVTGMDPNTGDETGGTTVTITGTGFTGATDVGFGATSATTLFRRLRHPNHRHQPHRYRHDQHHRHPPRRHQPHHRHRPIHLRARGRANEYSTAEQIMSGPDGDRHASTATGQRRTKDSWASTPQMPAN